MLTKSCLFFFCCVLQQQQWPFFVTDSELLCHVICDSDLFFFEGSRAPKTSPFWRYSQIYRWKIVNPVMRKGKMAIFFLFGFENNLRTIFDVYFCLFFSCFVCLTAFQVNLSVCIFRSVVSIVWGGVRCNGVGCPLCAV